MRLLDKLKNMENIYSLVQRMRATMQSKGRSVAERDEATEQVLSATDYQKALSIINNYIH